MPHIHCYLGNEPLTWTMVVSDGLIGLSYLSISLSLYFLIRKIKLPFQSVFIAFGLFIFACGATHFLEIYTLWVPAYWEAAMMKVITAVASVMTAIALYPLNPKIVAFASAAKTSVQRENELQKANQILENKTSELDQSRYFVDSLIENIPNMVFVKDAKDLKFVRINRAGEELLGIKREELLGKSDFDFFTAEQALFFIEKDRAVLSGNKVLDIPCEEITTQDKGKRFLHTRKIPLINKDGVVEYLIGISDDITDRIKADEEHIRLNREQAALEERESAGRRNSFLAEASTALAGSLDFRATLKKITEISVPSIADWCTITILNGEGKFDCVASSHRDPNKQNLLEEFINYSSIDPEKRSGFAIGAKPVLSTKIISEADLINSAEDNQQAEILKQLGSFSCILVPIPGRDKVHGSIAFVTGESKRYYQLEDQIILEELGRRAGIAIDNAILYETAQKAIEVRDEFLSIASHELKTPITSLKLQLQLTQRAMQGSSDRMPTPEKIAKVVDNSITQLNRLTRLVEDLLDVTKIQAGKMSLDFEEVNLALVIDAISERFEEQLRMAKCDLEVHVGSDMIGIWDPSRIEQIFENLISNAIKYAPGKPIQVFAEIKEKQARIVVKDFGPGIPKDKQVKIFNRFERATGSRNISGLGLGLFIVKQIVEAQGGTIEVESDVGRGSEFIVYLPTQLSVKLGKAT